MGGSTPKQRPSAQEVEQARAAAQRWNERIDDGYLQLEREGVADAYNDHSGYIGGRASADLAKEESKGVQQTAALGGIRDMQALGRTTTAAEATQEVDAAQTAQRYRDNRMIEMGKVGQDVAATGAAGLRNSAALGHERAAGKLQAKILEDNSRFAAGMQAASGLANGMAMRAEGFRVGKDGLRRTHEKGLFGAKPLSESMSAEEYEAHQNKAGNRVGWLGVLAQ